MTERDRERLAALALGDLPAAEADELRPAGGADLAAIESVIAALQAEAWHAPAPPPGLAAATAARLGRATPSSVARSVRALLADNLATGVSIAAGLLVSVAVTGLLAAAVGKVRHESRVVACRNQLRDLHFALDGYAQTHARRYPEVGTPGLPVAGELAAELGRAGQAGEAASCPAGGPYAYSLGYRAAGGRVLGLRRGEADTSPIAADAKLGAHGPGRNVLYTGGAVRYATTAAVGPDGDDIFINQLGEPRAGLHRADASLGGAGDYP